MKHRCLIRDAMHRRTTSDSYKMLPEAPGSMRPHTGTLDMPVQALLTEHAGHIMQARVCQGDDVAVELICADALGQSHGAQGHASNVMSPARPHAGAAKASAQASAWAPGC